MNENPSFIIIAKRNYESEYDYEEVVGNTVVMLTKNDYNVSVETDKEIEEGKFVVCCRGVGSKASRAICEFGRDRVAHC